MRDYQNITRAFDQLRREERHPAALATVVRVAGSSYRRPGARMLVAADGRTWGGVSGGCLEREVIRRARLIIESGKAALCRFDTTDELDESDASRGVALGCAGVIDIFIQRVDAERTGPLLAIRNACVNRTAGGVATSLDSTGACYTSANAPAALAPRLACVEECEITQIGETDTFLELIRPPQSLVLIGGGVDVVPVVEFAKTLGWHVSVIASHAAIGSRERFAAADVVALGSEADPFGGVTIEAESAVVLMTHNYVRDLAVLERLLTHPPRYVGVLGPRRRAERLVLESREIPADIMQRLYAPVGLDLGANTPEAIALSIVAEIQAVLNDRDCRSLRDRSGPIYDHESIERPDVYTPSTCPVSA